MAKAKIDEGVEMAVNSIIFELEYVLKHLKKDKNTIDRLLPSAVIKLQDALSGASLAIQIVEVAAAQEAERKKKRKTKQVEKKPAPKLELVSSRD